MDLLTKSGQSKIVAQCTYPLTGLGCVKRVYTDHATFECSKDGISVIDTVEGLSIAELEGITGISLKSKN